MSSHSSHIQSILDSAVSSGDVPCVIALASVHGTRIFAGSVGPRSPSNQSRVKMNDRLVLIAIGVLNGLKKA